MDRVASSAETEKDRPECNSLLGKRERHCAHGLLGVSTFPRGSDWAPSVDEASRSATHRPFKAGQAEAPIAALQKEHRNIGESTDIRRNFL